MTSHRLFLARGVASLATLAFSLPVCLGAQTTIEQTDIADTSSVYWDSENNMWGLNGGVSYANSGDLNFGTTASGDNLSIGVTTTNSLTISSGTVTDYKGLIGYSSGSIGTVTVTGASSTWTNTEELCVGVNGTGTLYIGAGGKVSSTVGYIGASATGPGTVTVNGAGSSWNNNTGVIYIGLYGTGVLNIENGGAVSSNYGYVGYSGNGTATVTGTNSAWTNTDAFYVGAYGTGTLNIEAGGKVSSASGTIGQYAGSNGTVTVNGPDSTWTNTGGSLYIGDSGTATLTIENGGTVSNAYGYVGYENVSHGTVTVTGAGSTWTNTNVLYVSSHGTGTLTIEMGGKVSSNSSYIGYLADGTGKVTVTGAGSTWTNTGGLAVGQSGTGTLNIENGGKVSSSSGDIGQWTDSHGTATVTGANSSWTNTGALSIGNFGTGNLYIKDGALVTASTVNVRYGAIYLGGGYLALASTDATTDLNTLNALLDGGVAIYAWNGTTYELITSSSSSLISCDYYSDITTYDVLDGYNLTGGYTVLTSLYSVPEPSTYALFGGLGALGLALLRRKRR